MDIWANLLGDEIGLLGLYLNIFPVNNLQTTTVTETLRFLFDCIVIFLVV